MMYTTILGAALTAVASASPVDLAKRTGTQQLATFDDLPTLPAVSQLSPVGVQSEHNSPAHP